MTEPSEKKRRGRPKGAKNKPKVVKTKFGTVILNRNSKQKKVLDQILYSSTAPEPSNPITGSMLGGPQQGRQIPQNDIKNDHLLVKGISLVKNMQTGKWEISRIETNHGNFATGEEQTSRINQALVRTLVQYLKGIFEEDLKTFISEE